jgi:hypothetical protein
MGIGARHITISTVGVPNAMGKMAQYNTQCTLAISLHAATQAAREAIVPRWVLCLVGGSLLLSPDQTPAVMQRTPFVVALVGVFYLLNGNLRCPHSLAMGHVV